MLPGGGYPLRRCAETEIHCKIPDTTGDAQTEDTVLVKGYLHRSSISFPLGWKKENIAFFKRLYSCL
jgi:hypothetical protein